MPFLVGLQQLLWNVWTALHELHVGYVRYTLVRSSDYGKDRNHRAVAVLVIRRISLRRHRGRVQCEWVRRTGALP